MNDLLSLPFWELFLTIIPHIVWWSIVILAWVSYMRSVRGKIISKFFSVKTLLWSAVGFRIVYAIMLTVGQYYKWSGNELTQIFTTKPIGTDIPIYDTLKHIPFLTGEGGYFIFYAWGRFWMNVVLSLVCAYLVYLFLKVLKKHKERFFLEGEVGLAGMLAVVVGWPYVTIFLPFAFLSVVLVSIFNLVVKKEAYTTVGIPFLVATVLTLLLGRIIFLPLGLWVLWS
jgi:hypothetical protein